MVIVSHLNAVTNSPAWREAYNGCLAQISAYYTELGQNTDLYQSYQTLADSNEFAQLNTAQQQAVNNALRDFKLSGVALPTEQKQRFAAIEERLSAICAKFADNLLDATQAWHKPTITRRVTRYSSSKQNLLAQLAHATRFNRPYCDLRCARLFSSDDLCRQSSTARNFVHRLHHTRLRTQPRR
jgi:oligopeptidase A